MVNNLVAPPNLSRYMKNALNNVLLQQKCRVFAVAYRRGCSGIASRFSGIASRFSGIASRGGSGNPHG